MTKISRLCLVFVLTLLLLPGTVLAEGPNKDTIIWWAEYFDNAKLHGNPIRAIREDKIDHDWGYGIPLIAVPNDHFSVRWTTDAYFEEGQYTFNVTADDGVRLWVDGKLLIDQWREQSLATFSHSLWLEAGDHQIQMAYFEKTGAAIAKLWWRQDPKPQPKPDVHHPPRKPDEHGKKADHYGGAIVVDNTDPGFVWGGSTQYRNNSHGGHGYSFYWTKNTERYPTNSATWKPYLHQAGYYEVYAFIPANHATAEAVRYRIIHAGERHDKVLDQAWYYDQWVSLGKYYFDGYGNEYVAVYDNTRETNYSTRIAFDAIKWVPVH